MRIAIGSDHRGCDMKEYIKELLTGHGHTHHDFGCYSEDAIDYPDVALEVAVAIVRGDCDRGVLICGTGIGMCISANKVNGIRAAQCYDAFTAKRARLHNDAQVCCIAAEAGKVRVPSILEEFLTTEFEAGRHIARVEKIRKIEEKQCR
ncbi:MAG: ribose 5-phosphate isomerase B [Dehalococcoidales bacterium]|nr:ribose 5-phosphate isomerase B [Dehalococcoidales bacterium]